MAKDAEPTSNSKSAPAAKPDNRSSEKSAKAPAQKKLAAAIGVKGAVHGEGLVGGIALKAIHLSFLRKAIRKPDGRSQLEKVALVRTYEALEKVGISYGIKDEEIQVAVDDFLELIDKGEQEAVAHKVAEGEAPEPGEDGWIEYPLNYRGRSFRELANLPANSKRKNVKVVHAQDALAIFHPPTAAKKGTSVLGETLSSKGAEPKTRSLEEVAGPHTEISGKELLAECDGACEEDLSGRLRVIPEIVVPRVDETTGRIPESGLSQANVVVTGDVKGGPGVATAENLFIGTRKEGGTVEGSASIQAKNLVLRGRMVGASEKSPAPVEVEEICVVEEVLNRSIRARRIFIAEDGHFAQLDAEHDIRVDGNLRGGSVHCRNDLHVHGDLGTEAGGSNTRIALPTEAVSEQRKKKLLAKVRHY